MVKRIVEGKIGFPAQAIVQREVPRCLPGVLDVQTEIAARVVLDIRISLQEGVEISGQKVAVAKPCYRRNGTTAAIEAPSPIGRSVVHRGHQRVNVIHSHRDLMRPANDIYIICALVSRRIEVTGIGGSLSPSNTIAYVETHKRGDIVVTIRSVVDP